MGILRSKDGTIAISGNSVLTHASRCDPKAATVAELLASDHMARPVLDMSFGGQVLDETVHYAALALRRAQITDVVAMISLFSLNDWNPLDLRRLILFKAIDPAESVQSVGDRFRSAFTLEANTPPALAAFDYRGQHYPSYDEIKARYFAAEKDRMPCPEDDGGDRNFIEAYYNHSYLGGPILEQNLAMLQGLGRDAAARGKRLHIVLLPIDYGLIESMQGDMADQIRQRAATVVTRLQQEGLSVVDLSGQVASSNFADRWCACGHLLLQGREQVSAATADALTAPKAAMRDISAP
jgi:hypothetical protein